MIEEAIARTGPLSIEWAKEMDALCLEYSPAASDDLLSFRCGLERYTPDHWELESISRDVPNELVEFANDAWRDCGGSPNPERGYKIIRAARVEFARSCLHAVTWAAGARSEFRPGLPDLVHSAARAALQLDWANADLIAACPPRTGISDSIWAQTYDWCSSYDNCAKRSTFQQRSPCLHISTPPNTAELFSALALVWIDCALLTPERSVALLAMAAGAHAYCRFEEGWQGHEEMLREAAVHAGKKGGLARHEKTRSLKDWAVREARNMRGSHRDIARQLSRIVPDDLKDASEDPQRLIYEALRNLGKGKKASDTKSQ